MTLQLAVKLSLDKGNLAAGAREAGASVTSIGDAAIAAAGEARQLETALRSSSRSIADTARADVASIRSVAEQIAATRSSITRSSLGVSVVRSAADIQAEAEAIAALRARLDPLTAATRQYTTALAAVEAAHRVGAISGAELVGMEVELKAAYDRTTASLANRAAAQKTAVERIVGAQTTTPDRGADIAAYGEQLDQLRARYNPVWAAGQRYRQEVEEISRAERVGAISAAEAIAAKERARTATSAQVAALRGATAAETTHAGAMKLTAFQAQNLSYQLHDVVVSLASGMNPMTVLLQQGSQITPIFGGVRGTLAAVASVVNPLTVSIAALAVGTAVAGKAWWDYTEAMRDADVAARGVGRGAGTTAAEIDTIARSSADAAGVSVSAARSMATEFTRTGRIGSSLFGEMIGLSKDFGATIGQDTTTAAKTLADLVADPARGAQQLAESYGLIDSSSARLIQRLADQGRATEAQQALLTALSGRLVPAGETVNWFARQWDALSKSIANAYDAMGRGAGKEVDPIADLERKLEDAKRLAAIMRQATPTPNGIWGDLGPNGTTSRADDEVRRLEKELEAARKKATDDKAAAEQRRQDAEGSRLKTEGLSIAGATGSSVLREAYRRQQLTDEIAKLTAAQTASNATPQEEAQLETAIAAKTRALETWISESTRSQQLAEIDLQISASRDPIERAELERKRVLVTMAGQEVTATEAAAASNLAYARALGEVAAQARGSITDTLADAAARTRVNALVAAGVLPLADVNRELQIEAATRQLVTAAARAEGAEKERLLGLIGETRAAITAQTDAQRRADAAQEIQAGGDRLQTLRTQIALIGQSEATQARVLALLEAEQKIRSQGYAGADADRIRAEAIASADLTSTLNRQKAAWDEVKSTGGDAIDTLIEGMRTGEDVGKSLADNLSKEFLKLAVANPLKNMLFGQNLPTASDVGGLLGNLFGNGDRKGVGGSLFADSTGGAGSAGTVTRSALAPIGASNDNGSARIAGAWGLFDARRAFSAELSDPSIRSRLFAMTEAEVGGQGSQAQTAFMESVFNRASARGQTLQQTLGANYYAPESIARISALRNDPLLSAKYDGILRQVQGGSNVSSWATGNASGAVGFGGGPQTALIGGEKFGIERADLAWAQTQKSATAASQSLATLDTSSKSAVDAIGQFGPATNQATQALTSSSGGIAQASGQMGTTITSTAATTQSAFGQLTSGLSSAFSSLFSGLGSVLSNMGGGIGSLFGGLFGFAEGGYTGSIGQTSIAGVVHGGEYVINAASTARHRPLLEAINDNRMAGYASGGYVAAMPMAAAPSSPRAGGTTTSEPFQQTIINNTGAQISTREETTGSGGRRQIVVIDEVVAQAVGRARGKTQRALTDTYGMKNRVIKR